MNDATPPLQVLVDADDVTGVIVVRGSGVAATDAAMARIHGVLRERGKVYDARMGEWFELTFEHLCHERSKKDRREALTQIASTWCAKLRSAGFEVEGPHAADDPAR